MKPSAVIRSALACIAVVLLGGHRPVPASDSAAVPLPGTKGWIEARSAHFTVYSDAGESRARKTAIELERFRLALSKISRGLSLGDRFPSVIYAFRNDSTFTPYKPLRGGRPSAVSGYFLATPFRNYIALDASAGSSSMKVVYHEYFHQVLRISVGDVPLWLNEGLAQYFGTFRTEDLGAVVQVGHRIPEYVESRWFALMPWSEVFAATVDSPAYNEERRQGGFYAQSWVAVHYLAATDARLRALGRYLQRLREGADPDEALQAAFGMDRTALATAVEEYSQRIGNYIWLDLGDDGAKMDVAVRKLSPGETSFRLGDLLAHQQSREPARRHLEAARAAEWPAAEVETALGQAAAAERDKASAESHLRKAVEAGAASAEPYVLLGTILFEKVTTEKAGATTPTDLAEARGFLRTAIEKEPESVPALRALAGTYLFESATGPGIEALVKARRLRPYDAEVLELGACLLARGGKPAAAGALVERTAVARNATRAKRVDGCVAAGAMSAAADRLNERDADGARRILAEALAAVHDPEIRSRIENMDQLAARGIPVAPATAR